MTKQENKNSAKKKLIPAVAMLTTSAVMLSTSTYAWFTMSREVEVQNIQMTATTPEDIQISLGQIYKNATEITDDEDFSLANSTGWLKTNDTDGMAIAPRVDGANNDELDWSNIVDISKYYEFGKLIPASSTDGVNVFYTPDASGVGRTLTATAKFYQAAAGKTAYKTGDTSAVNTGEDSAKATAHILTNEEIRGTNPTLWSANTTSGYKTATAWNGTNDDGYYIDIPVWLRTSSTETGGTDVYVSGYVTSQKGADVVDDKDADDLYKAVRVAILTVNESGEYVEDKGCLTLADGSDKYIDPVTGQADHSAKFPIYTDNDNILDSKNYNDRHSSITDNKIYAVNNIDNVNNGDYTDVGHEEITQNNATEAVATLQAGTGTNYGEATKLIVRVWLEGEDGNCWNENAGQNWNIALKFSKDKLTATKSGN